MRVLPWVAVFSLCGSTNPEKTVSEVLHPHPRTARDSSGGLNTLHIPEAKTNSLEPSQGLRGGMSGAHPDQLHSPMYIARNLITSIGLLFGVLLAASMTIREAATVTDSKPGRECPLQVCFTSSSESDRGFIRMDEDEPDAFVDWDKILLTSKYECVLDPLSLSIYNLLVLPPPTFKSMAGWPVTKQTLTNQLNAGRQYVNIGE
jgi:hypothetical protein